MFDQLPYDVGIIGGGPAGAATALALRRRDPGVRIALVERTDYSAFRVGETLPPPARRLLAALGVWDAFPASGATAACRTRAAWGSAASSEEPCVLSPFGRGWHIDRTRFDAWLAAEAERAGAEVVRRARGLPAARRDGMWTVMVMEDGGAVREIQARVIVDATGRHSRIARSCGARHLAVDALVGIAMRLRVEQTRGDAYTEIEACPDGWWYTATLADGHLAAIFMTDADSLQTTPWRTVEEWRALAASAPLTAARIADGVAAGDPIVCPASSQRLDACAGDAWLAVGDAASTVDPLSSQGVMRALRSGIVAARAIHDHARGDRQAFAAHHAGVVKGYDAYLEMRRAYYAMEQRWSGSPFWRRRHAPVAGGGTPHAVRLQHRHPDEREAAR